MHWCVFGGGGGGYTKPPPLIRQLYCGIDVLGPAGVDSLLISGQTLCLYMYSQWPSLSLVASEVSYLNVSLYLHPVYIISQG